LAPRKKARDIIELIPRPSLRPIDFGVPVMEFNSRLLHRCVVFVSSLTCLAAADCSLAAADCSSVLGDEIVYLQSHAELRLQSSLLSDQNIADPQPTSVDPAARLQAARPVAWVHVPKCGSSFANVLLYLPGMCPLLRPGYIFDEVTPSSVELLGTVTEEGCSGSFSSEGRTQWSDHSGIGPVYESSVKGHGFIMLRQPEQRIMSAYYDNQHSWPYQLYSRWATDPFEYAQVLSGCAVRLLTRASVGSGNGRGDDGSTCGDAKPVSAAEVILARKRLREGFVFVGLVEEWDMSVCLLHAALGGDCSASDFANMHPGSNASQELYETSELMGFTDVADGALYKEASAMFAEQLGRYALSYSACQPCFQQALSSKS